MFRRGNKRKNKPDKSIETTGEDNIWINPEESQKSSIANETIEEDRILEEDKAGSEKPVSRHTMSREEFIAQNEDAKKVMDDIKKLRASVEQIKATGVATIPKEVQNASDHSVLNETEDVIAAKQAILEQAQRDAYDERIKQAKLIKKQQEELIQSQKLAEAERRVALAREEAERKRLEAIEADRIAKEVSRKKALEQMEAERRERIADESSIESKPQEKPPIATAETTIDAAKQALLTTQKQQEATLGVISQVAEKKTNRLASVQQEFIEKQERIIEKEKDEITEALQLQEQERIARLTEEQKARLLRKQKALEEKRLREEKARALKAEKQARMQELKAEKQARMLEIKAEKQARAKAEKEAKLAKILAEREEKRIREEKKKLDKQRKAKERELIRRAKKDEEARKQLELMRAEAKSRADAALGGGIVDVQGLKITTEIKEIPNISWRDFFALRSKEEKNASSEKKKEKLEKERLQRAEEARELVDISLKRRIMDYRNTKFAKVMGRFKRFCDRHKVGLLTSFAVLITLLVAAAGVVNYYTAYAYSYNGKILGLVKEKDDVLRITNLVQGALTEDKNVKVIIDPKKDIYFNRVPAVGDVKIDTSEDVLKRLTYMGDLKVKAYGFFVEGKRIGAVANKEDIHEALRILESDYKCGIEDSEVKNIKIKESYDVSECNASLEDILTIDELVEAMKADTYNETLYEVGPDESLEEIAEVNSITVEQLVKDNPNLEKNSPKLGTKLVIKREAPVLSMEIIEKVNYEKVIEHKVEKKKTKDLYEGYSETKQKGEDGYSVISSKITTVNGKQVNEDILKEDVKKKAVTEIILVGDKERPPSVGSGKYIWPLKSGYTLTSGFKWRWGRLHEGIDLGTPSGNDVVAADGGIVTFAGYSGGYGYLIKIDHQNGMETRYAHNSKLLVKQGDKVFQGMHIAESGNSGRSTGPHLHFEIRVGGSPKDPLSFLP